MKALAKKIDHECIMDKDGDICIRPMKYDDDGIREILYRPQPCEFQSSEDAAKLLALLAREAAN